MIEFLLYYYSYIYKIQKLVDYMKKRMGRRGLSPAVASVLMILLVLVLAVIIFLWARGFIGEQIEKFGEPIEKTCAKVKFEAVKFTDEYNQEVLEIRNVGNVDIRELEVKKFDGRGNSEIEAFPIPVDAFDSKSEALDFKMNDGSDPDRVVVYPALVGTSGLANSVFICMDVGVTL